MRQPINKAHIEGRIYEHTLEIKTVKNEQSQNFGKEFIGGILKVATDEAGLNVIPVEYTYVTATTSTGKANNTYSALKKIIETGKTWIVDGKDAATMVSLDTNIGLNDFYNNNDELVSAKRCNGGFVNIVTELKKDENARNTFEVDMLITNIKHIEENEEKKIPAYTSVSGAVFDFRQSFLPVEFIVDKPNGMQHFEALEATNANPIYTKVWGNIISRTIITTETEEGAFGEPLIREVQRKSKKWVIASTSKYPYDFGDEKILTMEEVQKAIQNREIYLAEVKKRAEDYKTQKQANALSAPTANVAAHVTTGEFQF